ncbi:MAG: hypothetical protein L6Q37_11695, partial [Bdellovibrionaceae bacterium]|nr:hypothetical protein [Pseudobdellovibrionaceae bacterium]
TQKMLTQLNSDKNVFLPLFITDFLNQNFDQIYSPFDAQVQRLRKVGDQNQLISAMRIFETARTANQKALTLVSNASNQSMFSLIRSSERRIEKLDQLINEANQCKSKTNSCLVELKTAMNESKVNLTAVKELQDQIANFLLEIKDLKSYFESTIAHEYDKIESESALRAIENMISKVESTLTLTSNVVNINRSNLISALSLQEEFYILNQSIKEMAASGPSLDKLNINGPMEMVNDSKTKQVSPKVGLIKQRIAQMMAARRSASQKLSSQLKKYKAVVIATAVVASSGLGVNTYIDHTAQIRQQHKEQTQAVRARLPQFYSAVDIAKELSRVDADGYRSTKSPMSQAVFKIYDQYYKVITPEDFEYLVSDLNDSSQDYIRAKFVEELSSRGLAKNDPSQDYNRAKVGEEISFRGIIKYDY